MKSVITLFLVIGWGVVISSGSPSITAPVPLTNAAIFWSAPTNKWPDKLWVYKVVPQEFSPAVISNLMTMSGFTKEDRTNNMLGQPKFKDKSVLYYRNADQSKHLGIFPKLGFIDYNDRKMKATSQLQPVIGVPTQDETTQLGLKYLRYFGIDVSQLANKPDSCDLFLHWTRETIGYPDQKTKEWFTLTNMCGVFFNRCIDGVPVRGHAGGFGGVNISFGNNAKIVDLQICWRNLKNYELRDCVSPAKVMEWIRTGQTALPYKVGPLNEIKKITIVEAVPLYYGKFPDEEMEYVFPYLNMGIAVENGRTTNTVYFKSGLISPELPEN